MGIRGSLAGTALGKSYKCFADQKVISFRKSYGATTLDADGSMRRMRDALADIAKAMKNMTNARQITFAEDVFDARGSLGGGTFSVNTDAIDQLVQKLNESEGAADAAMQKAEDVFDARGSLGGGTFSVNTDAIDQLVQKLNESEGAADAAMQKMEAGLGGAFRLLEPAAEGVSMLSEELSPLRSRRSFKVLQIFCLRSGTGRRKRKSGIRLISRSAIFRDDRHCSHLSPEYKISQKIFEEGNEFSVF